MEYRDESAFLADPESFIGPNARTILNFWIFIEGLTPGQWNKIEKDYFNLGRVVSYEREAKNVIGGTADCLQLATWKVPYIKYNFSLTAPIFAAWELAAMHKIIEDGKQLFVLPLFGQFQ